MSALNEVRLAVDFLKRGAGDYLTKSIPDGRFPASMTRVLNRLLRSGTHFTPAQSLRMPPWTGMPFQVDHHRSEKMRRILKKTRLHVQSALTALITGGSGTGKELLARGIASGEPAC